MQDAAKVLEGERDFAPFSGPLSNGMVDTRRRVFQCSISRSADTVFFDMVASGFLPQQVRRIAAALLQVGLGKLTIAAFQALADSGIRGAAEQVLAPNGLSLRAVRYATPLAGGEIEMDEGSYAAATRNQAH